MQKAKSTLKLIFLSMMLSVAFIGISSITETLGSEECPVYGNCHGQTHTLPYPPWKCCIYSAEGCQDYTTC